MNTARRFFAFIGRNATTVIALCSMVIAGCSLGLTYISQERDLTYREASIQPILGFFADVDTFSFVLQNEGMGPAVINRITFGLDGKCYDSDDKDQTAFAAAVLKFQSKVGEDIYKKTLPETTIKNRRLNISITGNPFRPPWVVRVGKDFVFFKLQPDTLGELQKLPADVLTDAKNKFASAVSMVPLSILFCSATGVYCESGQTDNDECLLEKQ